MKQLSKHLPTSRFNQMLACLLELNPFSFEQEIQQRQVANHALIYLVLVQFYLAPNQSIALTIKYTIQFQINR